MSTPVKSNIDKYVSMLQQQLEKLNGEKFDIEAWKSSTIIALERIFGNNNQRSKEIEKIKYSSGGYMIGNASNFWNNLDKCKEQGRAILEMSIAELESFGLPESGAKETGGINISLSQNQTVNIQFIMTALEDHLTGKQLREVKEIVKSEEPKDRKLTKIVDKLKSFGGDVVSNILANILTNPGIWGI